MQVFATLCNSSFCLDFPPSPHLQIDFPVPRGFLRIASGLLVQSRQPAVSGNQAGQHGEGGLERQSGAFAMTKPSECNS